MPDLRGGRVVQTSSRTVLGSLSRRRPAGAGPRCSEGVTLDAAKFRTPEWTCADSNLWACGAVVARVAYNDKPGSYLPQAVTSRNSHSCRSVRSIAHPATSNDWHQVAPVGRNSA